MAKIDFMQETVQTMLSKNMPSYVDENAFLRAQGTQEQLSASQFRKIFVESGELLPLQSQNLDDCSEYIISMALAHHPGSDLPLYHLVATELTEHPLSLIGDRYYYQATTGDTLRQTIDQLNRIQPTID